MRVAMMHTLAVASVQPRPVAKSGAAGCRSVAAALRCARMSPARCATSAPCASLRPLATAAPCSVRRARGAPPPPRAAPGDDAPGDAPDAPSPLVDAGAGVTFGLLWAGLVTYAALWAPNQTPVRDAYFLEKLLGVGVDDGVALNAVFFCLFNIMGVWPAVYAALLTPAGRSANGVPAWPFVTGSFALGAFALLPFFALWAPPATPPPLPAPAELAAGGVRTAPQRALESRVTAALLLVATLGLMGKAATAGPAAWADFAHLFQESKLVHVTSIDFVTLCLCAPFWVWNDAAVRRYEGPTLALALTPLLGPVLWLALRPHAADEEA